MPRQTCGANLEASHLDEKLPISMILIIRKIADTKKEVFHWKIRLRQTPMQMVLAYANDTNTIIEDNAESFEAVVESFAKLASLTGVILNKDKNEIVPFAAKPGTIRKFIKDFGCKNINDMSGKVVKFLGHYRNNDEKAKAEAIKKIID